jgi:hypothetical protein
MEYYYSAIKKNKTMLLAGKWMKLEIIMLSKISQTERGKYHLFSHMFRLVLKIMAKVQNWGTVQGWE